MANPNLHHQKTSSIYPTSWFYSGWSYFPGKRVRYINPELPQQTDSKVPAEEVWIGPTYFVNQINSEVNGFEYHIRADFPEVQAALLKITPEIIEKAR